MGGVVGWAGAGLAGGWAGGGVLGGRVGPGWAGWWGAERGRGACRCDGNVGNKSDKLGTSGTCPKKMGTSGMCPKCFGVKNVRGENLRAKKEGSGQRLGGPEQRMHFVGKNLILVGKEKCITGI